MSTEIYSFSGTGNSLSVAKAIAKKTNGTLIPIPSVINQKSITIHADAFGVVFPCYLAQLFGVPLMVKNFVTKLENASTKYVFAVCTCGGIENVNALPTLKNLGKLVKSNGGELAAEFSVKLPMNNLVYPSRLIEQNQEKMFKKAEERIEFICQFVNQRKKNKPASKALFNGCMVPLYCVLKYAYIAHLKKTSKEPKDTQLTYYELIPLTDKSICVDDNCSGCGTCAAVCPAKNIKMEQNRPVWQHHCEMCMACVEWCPTKAIHHWNIAEGKAYHHPSIKLSDVLKQVT